MQRLHVVAQIDSGVIVTVSAGSTWLIGSFQPGNSIPQNIFLLDPTLSY
jgi:hypothetical protein